MPNLVIETTGLTKQYGSRRGIVDVSIGVAEGEAFGFLGPNGAGKTTTMRAGPGPGGRGGRARRPGAIGTRGPVPRRASGRTHRRDPRRAATRPGDPPEQRAPDDGRGGAAQRGVARARALPWPIS